jgi:hypothetical protein
MILKPLSGDNLKGAIQTLVANHYSHSVPAGKSFYYMFDEALVVFSIPANKNIGKFLFGKPVIIWELTRLWAPNGHAPNLLTQAIAAGVRSLREVVPDLQAVVSYADPNVGHSGTVYRAASWHYTGQSTEGRYYSRGGQCVSRRAFHSGSKSLTKQEILDRGYVEERRSGKHRFVRIIDHRLSLRVLAAKRNVEGKCAG